MEIVQNESLPLEIAFLAEVQQIAELLASNSHVIEKLGLVIRTQVGDRLEFPDDGTVDD